MLLSVILQAAPGQGVPLPQPPQPVIPPGGAPVPAGVAGTGIPTQDQLAKLRSELDVVQGNVRVMSEMLTELSPSYVDPSDYELLQVIH